VDPQEPQYSQQSLFIGEIFAVGDSKTSEVYVDLKVNNENSRLKVDTAAQCNIISENSFMKINRKPQLIIMPSTMKLTAYGGMNIPIIGKCDMSIKHKTSTIQADFYVVRVPGGKPIIGLPTSGELNLINVKYLHEVNKDCGQDILDTDVFKGLGLVDGEYHIEINDDVK
jgi:hypothetical protein